MSVFGQLARQRDMLRYGGVADAFELGRSQGGNDIGWVSKLPCLTDLLDDSGAWQGVYRGEDNFSGVGHINVDIADRNAESPNATFYAYD